MLETEFVRSLQCNYERVHLNQKPDEQRYQYCILTRGGIRGLLPCSLRYINGQAYLYYDITSRQNVAQLYGKQTVDREWIREFFWSYEKTGRELGRFLLDERNILVYPEQIFQDLSSHNFFFLYLPYNEEDCGMLEFLEFVLSRMDYDDEGLVDCIYSVYEQYERLGEIYLQDKIFEDIRQLERKEEIKVSGISSEDDTEAAENYTFRQEEDIAAYVPEQTNKPEKRGILSLLGSRKKKAEEQKKTYKDDMLAIMEGRAVAEDSGYEEDYGRTIYVEQTTENENLHKLYTPDGRVAAVLEKDVCTIGKQKEEVDFVIEDNSVSRIHARIYVEEGIRYLEDLNSTNGTYKNGLRLQPYEKRRLEEGDEIRIGRMLFVYR